MSATILVVDDEAAMTDLLAVDLRHAGYRPLVARTSDDALAVLEREKVDVVVTDLRMPGRSGTELCREIVQQHPTIAVIVITGFGSMDAAIEAIRAGAYDFITKPFPFEKLQVALERALEHAALHCKIHQLRRASRLLPGLEELVGASPAMERVFAIVERIAPTNASVIITGESGTGKELVARALHRLSRRSDGPCVSVNCAAIPEQLFESELFGYVRGAFTGADRNREGLLRRASGGTLFLDEIGELPSMLQPKLLRVLQERAVRPVGSDHATPIDVRIIAATNLDLAQEVSEGRFRADLFYRLAVVTLAIPPLHDRGDDIILLAEQFLEELSDAGLKLDDKAVGVLLANTWPGNVRELRNWMEYAVAMVDGPEVRVEHLPSAPTIPLYQARQPELDEEAPERVLASLEDVERRHILRVLEEVGGNKSKAARILKIDRKTLLARLHRYEGSRERRKTKPRTSR